MSTTGAARDAAPSAALEKPKESRHRKEKKEKSDKHHAHESKHRHTRKTKEGESASTTASAVAAAGSEEEDWEENRAAVERLCAQYPNNVCCDCGESGTRWASVNHGVFVCIRCSGVHRSLGTHVSKVKSTNMDRWSLAEVRLMEAIGNAKGKTLYEARLPAGTRPALNSSTTVADEAMKAFIRRKYVDRAFAMHNLKDVLGRIYKDTGYGRPPKRPSRSGEAAAQASTQEEAPLDRAAITGKRGDTMRALYGEAAEEMQRGAAKRKKGGAVDGAAGEAADGAPGAAPKLTYGAFGLVNVPADEYEERWRRTVEAFAHVEAPAVAAAAPAEKVVEGEQQQSSPPPERERKEERKVDPVEEEAAATTEEGGSVVRAVDEGAATTATS